MISRVYLQKLVGIGFGNTRPYLQARSIALESLALGLCQTVLNQLQSLRCFFNHTGLWKLALIARGSCRTGRIVGYVAFRKEESGLEKVAVGRGRGKASALLDTPPHQAIQALVRFEIGN